MLTFLVNLDTARERRERMQAQLDAAGLHAERVGIDLRECSEADVHEWASRHLPQLRFDLAAMCAAEAGCWASHLMAWWRLATSDEPSCTVIEDDVLLANGFAAAVSILRVQHAFDVVYLGTSSKNISTRRHTRLGELSVHEPIGVIFNTWGYVVRREYVRRFFACDRMCIGMPIDHFLGGRAKRVKPRTGVLRPPIVSEDPAVGPDSQIQPYATRIDRHRVWQEARRAILGSKLSDVYYSLYKWL